MQLRSIVTSFSQGIYRSELGRHTAGVVKERNTW
jgi:hypothetical protein